MEPEATQPEDEFSDQEGDEAVAWHKLPPERDFFATPYDPPIKSLVAEIREKELIVRPSFQRSEVWDAVRKSRFVESVLLNIPIPTLFFAEDDDKTKVVVDGQQRLLALKQYMDNSYALKKLEVLAPLNGKRFDQLTERQQRIIGNRTLRCLVISARSDSEIRFQVFERLNQGGVPLNAQEVRHCVYRGPLNDLLHDLVKDSVWLALTGGDAPHPRMVDCELVLRYFAIRDALPGYSPPLKTLLNNFMRDHRHASEEEITSFRAAFASAIAAVHSVFPTTAFRKLSSSPEGTAYDRTLNRAVFDIEMISMEGMDLGWLRAHRDAVRQKFEDLCLGDQRFAECVSLATADKARLEYRLARWATSLKELGASLPAEHRIPALVVSGS